MTRWIDLVPDNIWKSMTPDEKELLFRIQNILKLNGEGELKP